MSDPAHRGTSLQARVLRIFAAVCAVSMFLVVVMGALVTDTGSEYGCGHSWPLCHGKFIPSWAVQSLIEYSHRAVAGVVGMAIVVLGVWAWRQHGRFVEVRTLSLIGIAFVWVQAVLGAAAVLWPQSAAVLALHFGFSLTAFAGVLLLAVVLAQIDAGGSPERRRAAPVPRALARGAWGLLAYTYLLVYLGAYVTHTNSGMACLGWPLCNGQLIPALHGATGVVFAHRVAALLALVGVILWRRRLHALAPERRDLRRGAGLALWATILQIGSGALLVLTHLSTGALLLHSTLVSAMFGALAYLAMQVLSAPTPAAAPS